MTVFSKGADSGLAVQSFGRSITWPYGSRYPLRQDLPHVRAHFQIFHGSFLWVRPIRRWPAISGCAEINLETDHSSNKELKRL